MACMKESNLKVIAFDLGHIPPKDWKRVRNGKVLMRRGWSPIPAPEWAEDAMRSGRLSWYVRHGVTMCLDDTSLGFVLTDSAGRRAAMLESMIPKPLWDWKPWARRLLPGRRFNRVASERTRTFETTFDGITDALHSAYRKMMESQCDAIAASVYAHTRANSYRDIAQQKGRILRCATSPLMRGDDEWAGTALHALYACCEYAESCYLANDRLAQISGLVFGFIISICSAISAFSDNLMAVVVVLVVSVLSFVYSIPRR